MTTRWLSLRVLVLLAVTCCCRQTDPAGGSGQATPTSAEAKQILDDLPEADDDAIRTFPEAQKWPNPFVVVNRDDYELIVPDVPRGEQRWDLAQLEQALMNLPREKWPLGRVIGVQENGIRMKSDNERIARNLKALKEVLESHKVRVDQWPTA